MKQEPLKTDIQEQLKRESVKKRRKDRLIVLYKGLKGAASIPTRLVTLFRCHVPAGIGLTIDQNQ